MNDEQLKRLLAAAGWRLFYTYENGEEEFTGPGDSDTPNLAAIHALVDVVALDALRRLASTKKEPNT